MTALPINNLDEHLARFAATTKKVVAPNPTTGTTGNRQFTFRKALSLNKNATTKSSSVSSNVSTASSSSIPPPLPRSFSSGTSKFGNSLNSFNAGSTTPKPGGLSKNKAGSSMPKRQNTITDMFNRSNSDKEEKSVPSSSKAAGENFNSALGNSFETDDLDDFDIPKTKRGASFETSRKKGVTNRKTEPSVGNKEIVIDISYSEDVDFDLPDLQVACKKDGRMDCPGKPKESDETELQEKTEVLEDDETISKCRRKKKSLKVLSDDEEDISVAGETIKPQDLPKQTTVPETQLIDSFKFSPPQISVDKSPAVRGGSKNLNSPVRNTSSNQTSSTSALNGNSEKRSTSSSVFSQSENTSLMSSDLQTKSDSELRCILLSSKERNYNIMSKICSFLEKEKDILEKHKILNSLMKTRNNILRKIQDTECAIKNKGSSVSSLPFPLHLSPNPKDKMCASNKHTENNPEEISPKVLPAKKLSALPLFKPSQLPNQHGPNDVSNSSLLSVSNFDMSPKACTSRISYKINSNSSLSDNKHNFLEAKFDSETTGTSELIETADLVPNDLDFCEDVFDISDHEDESKECGNSLKNSRTEKANSSNENNTPSKQAMNEKIVAGKFYGNHFDAGASTQFKGTSFPHSQRMLEIFINIFGLKNFRHNQLEAINAALLNEDCFVLMPTGGGKSLCYQLPALLSDGVTLVVSPLRSLIMDQIQKLWSLDIPANSLSSDTDASSVSTIYRQLASREPGIKLLYVTPEKISASTKLMSVLENLFKRKMLARFVIDEAHCISQWGHDFRPDYKKLRILRTNFPGIPMIALTATATPRVRLDILHQLSMQSPKWFLQSFNRPNLKYEIRPKKPKSVTQDIIDLIKSKFKNMSGIVYCLSRNDCDTVAADLSKSGIKAVSYHAGLHNRTEVQERWINDHFKVVCATIAFGMGIDKPDVRFVIHHAIPKSIEGYYQESGRAGRDGEISWCILYYSYQDMSRIKRMIQGDEVNKYSWQTHFDNLYKMVYYCENKTDCRRVQMLEYFGEIFDRKLCIRNPKTSCDNCLSEEVFEMCDATEDAKAIIQCICNMAGMKKQRNFTLTYFVDIFKGAKTKKILGAGHDKVPLHGRGQNYLRGDAERLLRKLVLDKYLQEEMIFNQMDVAITYVYPGPRSSDLLQGKAKVHFALRKDTKKSLSLPSVNEPEDEEMRQLEERCYAELIEVSKTIAAARNIHYTNVINIEALRQMSREVPMSEEDMLRIPHVTRVVYDKYGPQFLDVTQRYGAEKCVIDAERADKYMMSIIVDNPEEEWLDESSTPSTTKTGKSGRKRKKTTKGPPAKRSARSWFKNKARSKWKRTGANSQRNSSQGSSAKKRATSTQIKSNTSSSARVPGFLPAPKPQNKASRPTSRSFLPSLKVVPM